MGVCRPSERSDDCDKVDCCEDSSNPSGPMGPEEAPPEAGVDPEFSREAGGPGGPEAELVGGVGPLGVDVGGKGLAAEPKKFDTMLNLSMTLEFSGTYC